MKPGEEIRLVKENLSFAVALSNAAVSGKIPPGPLLRPGSDHPQFNHQFGSLRQSESDLAADLSRGAANQMRAAFALSALQSQRSMASAFRNEPIEEEWPELRAARCSLYLIGLAVQRSILQPIWECPPPYRRLFHIRRFGFTLNAAGLEGRALSWDDFGGLMRYLDLLDYCAASADAEMQRGNASRTLPKHSPGPGSLYDGVIGAPAVNGDAAAGPRPASPPRGYPGEPGQRQPAPIANSGPPSDPHPAPANGTDSWEAANGAHDTEQADAEPALGLQQPRNGAEHTLGAGREPSTLVAAANSPAITSVHRFVAERCEVGQERRMLAGELYAGFLEWCGDSGHAPISQRAFGMRLTSLGLTRKRRGHGKHWWEGIRLADPWRA